MSQENCRRSVHAGPTPTGWPEPYQNYVSDPTLFSATQHSPPSRIATRKRVVEVPRSILAVPDASPPTANNYRGRLVLQRELDGHSGIAVEKLPIRFG